MDKNIIIVIVLAALILIAAIQAFQLVGLKNSISSGSIRTATTGAQVQASGGGGNLPGDLESLPGMVGGC